ncbi:hypothetical protein Hamer_G023839, partial [Homarus americanus]
VHVYELGDGLRGRGDPGDGEEGGEVASVHPHQHHHHHPRRHQHHTPRAAPWLTHRRCEENNITGEPATSVV